MVFVFLMTVKGGVLDIRSTSSVGHGVYHLTVIMFSAMRAVITFGVL